MLLRVGVNLTARDGKAQLTGVLVGSGCSPRAPCRVSDSVRWEHRGGCWELSGAYATGVRVVECRYGAPGFGVWTVLRTGFRERSGAGVRVALGYVQKGFPSRANRGVPEDSGKSLRNLTERLTGVLTTCLTTHLTARLTFSGDSGRWRMVSGHGLKGAAALGLGLGQNFRHHGMVDSEPPLDHGFP